MKAKGVVPLLPSATLTSLMRIVGPEVALLDTGEAVARRVDSLLPAVHADAASGELRWYSSGEIRQMNDIGSRLWGGVIAALPLIEHDGGDDTTQNG